MCYRFRAIPDSEQSYGDFEFNNGWCNDFEEINKEDKITPQENDPKNILIR